MADDGHFPLTPQTPNNGGKFLLSLLQRPTNRQSQSQSQSQSPSQSNLSLSQIPSLDPSLPPPPWPSNTSDLYPVPFPLPPWLHQHQHQSLSTTPLPPNFVGFQNPQNPFPLPLPHGNQFSGNQFPSSASGNQIPGVFEGFNNLGFPGNHDRRPNESFSPLENKLQFGSFSPSLIPQVSMNGNNFKHEVAFGDLISNGLKRNQPSDSFNSYGSSNSNLNPNSNVNVNVHSFHHGQYNAPQNHPLTKGGEGHWDSGNNRRRDLEHGVNKDKVSLGEYGFNDDRGNRLSVRDGKVYVERSHGLELSAQHDHPGRHSSRSSLQSVSTLDTEASVLNLRPEIVEGRVRDRHQGQGWMKKDAESSNGNGNDSQELDNIGEQLVDSLLLEDEPDEKSDTKHVRREKDCRGNQLLTQRMRVYKRQMRCRGDINKLTSPLLAIYESLIPPKEEKEKQKQLLTSLEKLVVKEWPSARLCLFGSCANTFGVSNSDIDICLVLRDADIDKAEILLKLADILQSANLQDVQALARARVPIIKLKDSATGISCDICINNVLAVVNSKLLRDYAQIDVRLHQLAFIVKHWAKSRGVNETYQGTLSSYAYVLMCIHFLQHRRPPILPCLQEMKITYHEFVDDIECAYFDQVEHLQTFGSQNKESIAQLVWGFFNYWAYGHDYANSVISVRTGSIISKRAKDWTRRIGNDRHLICIEDPFETSHDLGRVVDKYSIKVLREEFERAAEILQCDPNPCETLFEPYIPS